ncbi:hypothetical protein VC83_06185 [Pseudogymnoascus destructans]|uniref:Uncharacterized protein n=2 Tax=Pseudogymnoascus destructans TaxID=655981 RepID=L8G212_PSED2|nr:uncharacterized protein VC83_06185 [Pseudogymnoascus destructans]ELR07310.1 hypothetical protein GMDG_02490 [Pseudogymnoascus destructans 20631-21]OAF58810.2 hypothetical protein VC83_06185 [Pseudogymnoascus destructans]
MLTYYPVWDVSYMVAQWFTWGSVVWVINSFLVWLPSVHPSSAFRGETTNGGGISAFIGATIFEIGSIFLMIEAVNENRTQCFGWAFEEALEENGLLRLRPSSENCTHHHPNKKNLVGNRKIPSGETAQGKLLAPNKFAEAKVLETWVWFPSLTGTTTSAKLASSPASPNTSLQPSSGSPASPPSPHPILPLPCGRRRRILGPPGHRGSGFIISSLLFMIETQERWWKPAPRTLGW